MRKDLLPASFQFHPGLASWTHSTMLETLSEGCCLAHHQISNLIVHHDRIRSDGVHKLLDGAPVGRVGEIRLQRGPIAEADQQADLKTLAALAEVAAACQIDE